MQCPDFRTRCVLLGSDFPQQSRCFVALPIGLDRGRSIHQPHAGDYKVSGAEVFGLAFHIGARVAAKARAGEVLVSSAVKDLMSQSGIRFKDRGVHQLKGVPERWHLYRVEH